MLRIGVLRYGLNWQLEEVRPVLHRSLGLPRLSLSTLSYLGLQFLVRWQFFCEERLLRLRSLLRPYLLQLDGTTEDGGPCTLVARDARTGVVLLARQVVCYVPSARTSSRAGPAVPPSVPRRGGYDTSRIILWFRSLRIGPPSRSSSPDHATGFAHAVCYRRPRRTWTAAAANSRVASRTLGLAAASWHRCTTLAA